MTADTANNWDWAATIGFAILVALTAPFPQGFVILAGAYVLRYTTRQHLTEVLKEELRNAK